MKEENRRKSKRYLPDVRLCVTGASNVGKSAIAVRFMTRRFIGEYQENVEQTYRGIMDVGSDTIKYDLKDTAASSNKVSNVSWATCIAVIYSITDHDSFSHASKTLEDIDRILANTRYNNKTLSIALIGNKKDLEHFRTVPEEDGRKLASEHGAEFWEVSASEDYNSTFRPLNSLIVEAFQNTKNSKNLTPSSDKSSPSSSGTETKRLSAINLDEVAKLLRRKSEPSDLMKMCSFDGDCSNNDDDDVIIHENNKINNNLQVISQNNHTFVNTIKRRRKYISDMKRTSDKMKKVSSSPPEPETQSTPTTPIQKENQGILTPNITIEVTDTTSEEAPSPGGGDEGKYQRSQSWSKQDKKRTIHRNPSMHRKNTLERKAEKNQDVWAERTMPKSRSFSDLKTLESEGVEETLRPNVMCKSALSIMGETETENLRNSLKNSENGGMLMKNGRSSSHSSFSNFFNTENNKNNWNKMKKEKKKLLTLSLEKVYDENGRVSPPNINENETKFTTNDSTFGIKHIGKKLGRRKFSSMFRPRSFNNGD